MRRSREEAAETRRRIVEQASRLFRARGIDAVSVADIMGALGLTVGGFYRHFDSKDALVAEAIDAASVASTQVAAAAPLLAQYLSDLHRRHPERGCPVAALCSEVGHQSRSTRRAFTAALERLIAAVEQVRPRASRQQVLHTTAAMVGGLVLARASADDQLAAEILQAVRDRSESELARKQ
jgi:TetR/AcrR family transcriptional regulator, transcriptional repressor for nem operon